MTKDELLESVHQSLDRFLEKADEGQLALAEYAFKGLADGKLRDLKWVLGRQAGRVAISQS